MVVCSIYGLPFYFRRSVFFAHVLFIIEWRPEQRFFIEYSSMTCAAQQLCTQLAYTRQRSVAVNKTEYGMVRNSRTLRHLVLENNRDVHSSEVRAPRNPTPKNVHPHARHAPQLVS